MSKLNALIVCGIDEVPTSVIVRIEQLEATLFVHRAHTVLCPSVADRHRTESKRRDSNASTWA